MTEAEIVQTSLERAFDNGLDWIGWSRPSSVKQINSNLFVVYMPHDGGATEITISWQEIIFSHDFLETFARYIVQSKQMNKLSLPNAMGERMIGTAVMAAKAGLATQLALAKDRLKYLEQFLVSDN